MPIRIRARRVNATVAVTVLWGMALACSKSDGEPAEGARAEGHGGADSGGAPRVDRGEEDSTSSGGASAGVGVGPESPPGFAASDAADDALAPNGVGGRPSGASLDPNEGGANSAGGGGPVGGSAASAEGDATVEPGGGGSSGDLPVAGSPSGGTSAGAAGGGAGAAGGAAGAGPMAGGVGGGEASDAGMLEPTPEVDGGAANYGAPGVVCYDGQQCLAGQVCTRCLFGEGSTTASETRCAVDAEADAEAFAEATSDCESTEVLLQCDGPEDCSDGEYCVIGNGPIAFYCSTDTPLSEFCDLFSFAGVGPQCTFCWTDDDCPPQAYCGDQDVLLGNGVRNCIPRE